jgi:predicted SAM-dependent methyltransferase
MKVNIGGQKNRSKGDFSDWVVVDIMDGAEVQLDISSSPLPFAEGSVDAIYTSHTLEHIPGSRLPFVLSEMNRCLRPGGILRVVVPDADKAIRAYVKGDTRFLRDRRNPAKMPFLPDHPLCYLLSWFLSYDADADGKPLPSHGHIMAFDFSLLRMYLQNAGFRVVKPKSFDACSPVFKGCDFKRYRDCSVYVEAVK